MAKSVKFSWDDNPTAVLGTVYLYLAYRSSDEGVPDSELREFVLRHQDRAGNLNEQKVMAAISAVRKLDGGSGLGASDLLKGIWTSLELFRRRVPRS